MADFAVKASDHPPAAWVTNVAKLGDVVFVRSGGSFHLDDLLGAMLPPEDADWAGSLPPPSFRVLPFATPPSEVACLLIDHSFLVIVLYS